MTSISELNQEEEDEVLAEDPDLTAADVTNATAPLPDAIAVLQREKEQVHAMNEFLMARSSHKRRHTRSTKIVRQAILNHQAGVRLVKADLRKKKDELIVPFDRALNNHQTFVEGIPDISEKRMTICQNWRT